MSKEPPPFIYTATGKQVLANGFHFADAYSTEAAVLIAEALNFNAGAVEVVIPCDICKMIGDHALTCRNGRKPN